MLLGIYTRIVCIFTFLKVYSLYENDILTKKYCSSVCVSVYLCVCVLVCVWSCMYGVNVCMFV